MIEIRHLRYVVETAKLGSFNRAADALGLKQATLSRQVLYLETRLGTRLFERSPRGASPTAAGHHVLATARRIVDGIEALEHARFDRNVIRLGVAGIVPAPIRHGLRTFAARHPDIAITLRAAPPEALRRALVEDALDAVITTEASVSTGAVSISLLRSRLIAVVAAHHTMAGASSVGHTDLAGIRLQVPRDGWDIADMLARHVPGSEVTMCSAEDGFLLALADGRAIGVVAQQAFFQPDLAAVAILGPDGPLEIEYLLQVPAGKVNRDLRRLVQFLTKPDLGRE